MADDEFTIPGEGQGQPWFDQAEEQAERRRKESHGPTRDEIAVHYAKCFGTRSGKIVMNDILGYAFSQAGFDPNLGFFNGAAHGVYRNGLGDLVSNIHRLQQAGTAATKR